MRFSILIPAHRWHEFLPDCIESVLQQTTSDWEVIVTHPRECGTLLKESDKQGWAADKRIRFINCEDAKTYGARIYGINAARGDYLLFLDSDDVLHPQALETLSIVLEHKQVDLVHFRYAILKSGCSPSFARLQHDTHEVSIRDLRLGFFNGQFLNSGPLLGTIAVRRDRVRLDAFSGNFQMVRAEDKLMRLELLDCVDTCVYLPDQLYFYRKHTDFVSVTGRSLVADDAMKFYPTLVSRATELLQKWSITSVSALDLVAGQYLLAMSDLSVSRMPRREKIAFAKDHIVSALKQFSVREVMGVHESLLRRFALLAIRCSFLSVTMSVARYSRFLKGKKNPGAV